MTTKTDEQERARNWLYLDQTEYDTDDLNKREVAIALLAYQAGRASLQSQDQDDVARLDWLQQSDGRFFKLLHITSIVGRGFLPTNSSGRWFPSLREAIDHARHVEENK